MRLSSNFKLSFLSRKQMFLLSFSNFRVYFQDKCLFSHRIQFTFFKTFFLVVQMILVFCRKVINLWVGKKAKKKKKIIHLATWSDFMGGAVVKTPYFHGRGLGFNPQSGAQILPATRYGQKTSHVSSCFYSMIFQSYVILHQSPLSSFGNHVASISYGFTFLG